jgi:predicted nucleic-acid-binding protein
MIAVDTNVLVRVVMGDDAPQTAASLRVLQGGEPVLLLNSVLLETAWVLKSVYEVPPDEIAAVLHDVMCIPMVMLESPATLEAVAWYREGMDFADAIHLAGAASRCEKLLTFDAAFVRKAKGKTACAVLKAD